MNRIIAETTQRRLRVCGWMVQVDGDFGAHSRAALKQFKRGLLTTELAYTDKLSPQTMRALRYAAQHNGRCSPHFTFAQFRSHGPNADGWIELSRALVHGLERMVQVGMPVEIVDGYRNPALNNAVGGEPNSIHLYGGAADLAQRTHWTVVRDLHVFSGIGYQGSTGLVRHVDVRGMAPGIPSTTPGTSHSPTTWEY